MDRITPLHERISSFATEVDALMTKHFPEPDERAEAVECVADLLLAWHGDPDAAPVVVRIAE
jgi:hypothetical protein